MRKNQSAFTLLEIMLVVTIIALLLGTAIYKLSGNVEYARHNRVAADIQSISTQLKLYESMNGFYPTTEQGLQALVTQPSSDPQPPRPARQIWKCRERGRAALTESGRQLRASAQPDGGSGGS